MTAFPAVEAQHRILVTGSRGKSSLVRLIFCGLAVKGLAVRGRITGVLPRELSPAGERLIVRRSPGHIEEMRWWLRQIPAGVEALVLENSAVRPELQGMAARWLRPTLVVWTNARADHQEVWGEGREAPEDALLRGVPAMVPLVAGGELAGSPRLLKILENRGQKVIIAPHNENFRLSNLGIARKALEVAGCLDAASEGAMALLPPDVGDFRLFCPDGATSMAAAFAANDPESTAALFSLLGWHEAETSVLFSDRRDRPARRAAFEAFLGRGWREMLRLDGKEDLDYIFRWMRGKRVFGCGNIAGAPLALLQELTRRGCVWTIPGA